MKRSAAALWRTAPGFLTVTRPGVDVLTVEGPGADIWNLLEQEISFEELAERLAERYSAPLETVRADLAPMIDRFAAEGLIEV